MSTIDFDRVSKRYDGRTVLSGLSLRIERGERITIHGPSGCGKTTILRLIAGFVPPDEGVVRIGNREAAANGRVLINPESRNLGMVFQDLALWPHLTVYENLEFALKAQGVSKKIREQRIGEMLARVHPLE